MNEVPPTSPPVDGVASLTLYEVNQELLQGKIPKVIYLKTGKTLIGRGHQCDVILNAQRDGKFIISRNHVAIEVSTGKANCFDCTVEDLGAINGTYVNGMRIHKYSIKSGDIIQFGGMCDVPEGYILEHSDVSVKYKFHFLPTKPAKQRKLQPQAQPQPLAPSAIPPAKPSSSPPATPKVSQKRKNESIASSSLVKEEGAKGRSSLAMQPSNPSSISSASSSADGSSANKNKKAKVSSKDLEQTELDKVLKTIKLHHHQDGTGEAATKADPSESNSRLRPNNIPPPSNEAEHAAGKQEFALLDELRLIKENQGKELTELRSQFFILQQSISRTEEHLAKAVEEKSRPQPLDGSKKIVETILKENQILREELNALRQQLLTAIPFHQTTPSSRSASKEPKEDEAAASSKGRNPSTQSLSKSSGSSQKTRSVKKLSAKELIDTNKESENVETNSKTVDAATVPPVPTISSCQIDIGSLKGSLTCTLCQQLLLDAVVLRCSHGFCRLCIEKHVQLEKSTCPICGDPPLKFVAVAPISSKQNQFATKKAARNVFQDVMKKTREIFYYRSDHLDSLVWMVLAACSEEERLRFREREELSWKELRETFGIDVNVGYKYAEGANQDLLDEKTAIKSSKSPEKGGSSRSGRSRSSTEEGDSKEEEVCEYCGESAHKEVDCPHRLESSSDNTHDTDDDDEEEEEEEEDL